MSTVEHRQKELLRLLSDSVGNDGEKNQGWKAITNYRLSVSFAYIGTQSIIIRHLATDTLDLDALLLESMKFPKCKLWTDEPCNGARIVAHKAISIARMRSAILKL